MFGTKLQNMVGNRSMQRTARPWEGRGTFCLREGLMGTSETKARKFRDPERLGTESAWRFEEHRHLIRAGRKSARDK